MHALIVDDDATNLEIASLILAHLGYTVTLCRNGEEAIRQCLELLRRVDLVIMDIVMPHMDGLEATRFLRSHLRTRDIPILCLSANAHAEHERAGLDAGCDHYLSKPYRREQLIDAIDLVLAKRKAVVRDRVIERNRVSEGAVRRGGHRAS